MHFELTAASLQHFLPIISILLVSGLVGGFVAGLLGVGGGIVTVPVLEYALRFADVPEQFRMHVAVATSLAAIIPTAISSTRSHSRRDAVDWQLARSWAVPMVLAALAGSVLASHAPKAALAGIFGGVALLIAAKMLLPLDHVRVSDHLPRGVAAWSLAGMIGCVSTMMGIGGGTLTVPSLNLCGYPIHRAVGTAAFFGLFIAIPGTLGYLLAHPPVALPFGTVGFVSLAGLALIMPGSMFMATVGARAAHALSRRRLSQAFGIFLLLVGSRMLYRALA